MLVAELLNVGYRILNLFPDSAAFDRKATQLGVYLAEFAQDLFEFLIWGHKNYFTGYKNFYTPKICSKAEIGCGGSGRGGRRRGRGRGMPRLVVAWRGVAWSWRGVFVSLPTNSL